MMDKHHSCLNTRAIIEFFQEHLPDRVSEVISGLGPEIDRLPQPLDFLMEINNWVHSRVVIQMFANARRITGDPDIAYKIGFESASRKKLGYVQRIILLAYKNPRRSLRRIQKINDKFNRNKTIEIVRTTRDSATIRLHWFPEIPGVMDFCRFNQGIYAGIPTIWNLPPAIVEETECYFKGAPYCEYNIQWVKKFSLKETLLNFLVPWRVLRYTIEELEKDKELLRSKFEEVHRLNLQLREKIDELLALQEELKKSEAKFRNLLDYVPGMAIQGYDAQGTILYWNKASEEIYGYSAEEAVGRKVEELIVPPELQEWFRQGLKRGARAVKSGEFMPAGEQYFCRKDGDRMPVHSIHTVVCLEQSEPLLFRIDVDLRERKRVEEELRQYRDHLEKLVKERTAELMEVNLSLQQEIQEHQRTEQALRASEERFRTIYEDAPIGIGLADLTGHLLTGNPALAQALGYSLTELRGLHLPALSHPDEAAIEETLFRELARGKRPFYEREGRCRRRDGTYLWFWSHVSPIRDIHGQTQFVLIMLKDITREKQIQDEIRDYQEQLRSLASELSLTEERERRRLAVDLHDNIGQILALAQIKLGEVQRKARSRELERVVQEVRSLLGQAIQYSRSLTSELGLPVLYDLGLEAAVEWLADQFQEQHGLSVTVRRDDFPKPLGEAASVLVFRVLRELLTNVVKHARATQVDIAISREGEHLAVQVSDNGQGFNPQDGLPRVGRTSGYGLFSIRERLGHLGGYLDIKSAPGEGTTVTLVVPLEPREMAAH
ncbi:MAG: PAS domain S-box protein [Desulfobaccales bacterium]